MTASSQVRVDVGIEPPSDIKSSIQSLYDNGDFTQCRQLLEANAQYPWSQTYLGNLYFNGNGVDKDFSTAVEYYNKAANKGYAQSQFYLGDCYEHGYGVDKDLDLAMIWYKKAAEKGHAKAQSWLGDLYEYKYGSTQNEEDLKLAFLWHKMAADQDVPESCYKVGVFYAEGTVVKNDDSVALIYFKKSTGAWH